MIGLTIRPALPEDIPCMSELLSELFAIEADFTPDREKQERGLNALLNDTSETSLVLVAIRDDVVIGMATVQTFISTAEGGRVGFVEDVIVDRTYRRMGVGTLLLDGVIAWSRKARLTRLQLLADLENKAALNFYSSRHWASTRLVCRRKLL